MRSSRGVGVVAVATAFVVVVAGAWFAYQRLAQPACGGGIPLTVAATPEIAPAVRAAADRWSAAGAEVNGDCVAITVTEAESVEVAAALAGQFGASLIGVGQAVGTAVEPDVWIPDSTTWLLRLRQDAPGFAPGNNAPVALSPVVVAMPEPVATRAGWPQQQLTWADLTQQMVTGTRLRAGIVEPTRDAAGLSGLLGVAAAAGASGDSAQETRTAVLRALATGRSALREDLLARFPRAGDPTSLAAGLGAAALSEEDVIEYNAKQPPIPLAALYLEPSPVPLDYPYAIMPGADPLKQAAATGLFGALSTPEFRNDLGAAGLRGPDGSSGAGFAAPAGAPSPVAGPPATVGPDGGTAGGLAPQAIEQALSSWSIATQSGRMLTIIDVSGSMLEPVPSAGGATREQVTVAAARQGLGLFDDSWAIGLWTFSTRLEGDQDWRELVPIGPLSSQRSRLESALGTITPKRTGDTGLYDTLLAAYETVQQDWEPGRVNSIVLFTDGRNDDDNGISQQELIDKLEELADPERPIQLIIVGIGDEVSEQELNPITKVTGGGVFVTQDPKGIGEIFLKAIALRPNAPR